MAVSFLGVFFEPAGGVSGASWTAFNSSDVANGKVWWLTEAGDCGGVGEVTIGVFGWLPVSTSVFCGIVKVGLDSVFNSCATGVAAVLTAAAATGNISIGAKQARVVAFLAIGIDGIGADTSDTLRMP